MLSPLLLKRLNRWLKGRKAPPFRATIIITNRCDLNCLFCRGRFGPKEKNFYVNELSKEEWIHVTKEGIKLGIKEWGITGGEPTIKNEILLDIIHLIKESDTHTMVTLTTNGSFLSSDVAKKLVQFGCDRIEIGIDGFNEKIHNFLRGSNYSFKKATNAVRFLSKEKKKLRKEKPEIIIKTVLNKKNYDTLDKLAFLAHSLGADIFKVIPMRIYEENIKLLREMKLKLDKKDKKLLPKIWSNVEKIGEKYGIKVEREFAYDEEETSKIYSRKNKLKEKFPKVFCYIPFYSLVIDGNGNVGPCSSIPPTTLLNPHNIRKKSLKEIWYKCFTSFRKGLLTGKPISKNCKSCGLVAEREFVSQEVMM